MCCPSTMLASCCWSLPFGKLNDSDVAWEPMAGSEPLLYSNVFNLQLLSWCWSPSSHSLTPSLSSYQQDLMQLKATTWASECCFCLWGLVEVQVPCVNLDPRHAQHGVASAACQTLPTITAAVILVSLANRRNPQKPAAHVCQKQRKWVTVRSSRCWASAACSQHTLDCVASGYDDAADPGLAVSAPHPHKPPQLLPVSCGCATS